MSKSVVAPRTGRPALELGAELGHVRRMEAHRHEPVGDLTRECDVGGAPGREVDRRVGVGVQDRLQRLAQSGGVRAVIRERDGVALVGDRPLAAEDLAHDLDGVAGAGDGLGPRLAVPALHDLRTRQTEPDDHAPGTGHGLDGGERHRGGGGRTGRQLHHAGGELDARRERGEIPERGQRVGAVGLARPHRVVAELLDQLDPLDRYPQVGARPGIQ